VPDVLSLTAPIFILIAIGYLAVRTRLMPQEAVPGLGRFVLYFSLPALIFSTLSRMSFDAVIVPGYLLVYGSASVIMLLGGIAFQRWVLRDTLTQSGVQAMGMAISNSAFIGYPLLLQVFDSPPTQAFAMSIIVENILILPLALVIIEYASGRSDGARLGSLWRPVFARVLRNPLILAIAAGMLVSAFSPTLPPSLLQSLDMLARASAAVALFSIGGSLVGNPLQGERRSIATVVVGKLLFHPLLVLLLVSLWPDFDPQLKLAMILMAAMPMFSVFPIIGSNYGLGKVCASILLLATALSFFTLTLLLDILL